jgi:hypothetical protein
MDGKNIADFVDPDIEEKLEALEREEERLEADGYYDNDSDMVRSIDVYLILSIEVIYRCSSILKTSEMLLLPRPHLRRKWHRKRRRR